MDDNGCVEMIANCLRNVACDLAAEEHAKRLVAEAELERLRGVVESAPVAELVM
jgi:hypothetical protein